jgi:hypothetical protein
VLFAGMAARDSHLGAAPAAGGQRPVQAWSTAARRGAPRARPERQRCARTAGIAAGKDFGAVGSNSNRVYALIETGDGMLTNNGQKTQSGSLWRSEDGGENQ